MATETEEEKHLRLAFKRNVERLVRDATLMLMFKRWPACAASSILAMEQASEYLHLFLGKSNPKSQKDLEDTFRNQHHRRLFQGLILSIEDGSRLVPRTSI